MSDITVSTQGVFAPLHFPDYRTTIKRNPVNDLVMVTPRLGELTGPVFGGSEIGELNRWLPCDLSWFNG
ncbi:hypothetical protein [Corynebacterium sp. HMSC29G08]|uniref:hypothetical protein n=1 Tax=Corynebacterium sp. HMSC29G08 TaxID=1581069 RepID=UPI0008A5D259|nr:hypothetical protein HMPREF3101_02980 [Corynebacterium sp. HMSC29G08]